jgi:hypothetical protein
MVQYSISYKSKSENANYYYYFEKQDWSYKNRNSPFQDWIRLGRPDAIFKYAEHWGDEQVLYAHYMPCERLLHIDLEMEYYSVRLFSEIDVDDANSRVIVRRLLCRSENHWPEIHTENVPKISNDAGGVSWYKKHEILFNMSITENVQRFFGSSFSVIMPVTVPKTTADQISTCEKCEDRLGDYHCGPWGRLIGTFFFDRRDAAVIIQKHFRAWRVRFKIDPNEEFGRFIERRRFEQWMREDET